MICCSSQKSLFVEHLKSVDHPAFYKLKKVERAVVMNLKWKTKENHCDCGVFAMMHMEQYCGEASSKFDCGLAEEGSVQNMQLLRLRIKYAAKMLLHEQNIHRGRAHSFVDHFMHSYSRELIVEQVKNAIKNRQKEAVKESEEHTTETVLEK